MITIISSLFSSQEYISNFLKTKNKMSLGYIKRYRSVKCFTSKYEVIWVIILMSNIALINPLETGDCCDHKVINY